MPDLSFRIGDVRAMPLAAVPTLAARLHITNSQQDEPIQSIVLNCQFQLQPLGRPYSAAEEARLLDLFGERDRWGQTMKPLHWMTFVAKVPPFTGETAVDLPLPCSLDFDVAANKYFYGLRTGSITIDVMFSGTIFFAGDGGALRIAQVPWDREARFQLPVEIWRQAIDAHYPESAWLRLPRESFDRLYQYKVRRGLPIWQQVIDELLNAAEQSDSAEEPVAAPGALP